MTIQDETSSRNAWRLESPGAEGWPRSARPGAPNKYFMVSADCHVTESMQFLRTVPDEFIERIPHVETRADGSVVLITEGNRPQMVKPGPKTPSIQPRQKYERDEDERPSGSRMEHEDVMRAEARFMEKIIELHPQAEGRPVVVGNCQAG